MYRFINNGCVLLIVLALFLHVTAVFTTADIDTRDMTMTFLERVAGLNLSNYNVTSFHSDRVRMLDTNHFQTDIKVVLSDGGSEFEADMTLVDEQFWTYRLYPPSDGPTEADLGLSHYLIRAKSALDEYQVAFNASYCSGFSEVVLAASQNASLAIENDAAVLKVRYGESGLTSSEYVKACWVEKINAQYAVSCRSVSLSLSKSGLVTELTDNMRLYHVATCTINVSKEQATSMAMPFIESYARSHQQQIVALNTTLDFVADISSSRGDRFEVYPRWQTVASYDRINNESVFGYAVSIWADTGEIYGHGPQGAFLPRIGYANVLFPLLLIGGTAAVLFGLAAYVHRRARCGRRQLKWRPPSEASASP